MKRANRLMVLNEEIAKIDRKKLIDNLKQLNEEVRKWKAKKQEIEKPFLDKIEELEKQIEQLKKEMDDAVLSVSHEISKIYDEARDIKHKLTKREKLLNEKSYLEFLEEIKKLVDEGWIIYRVDMATQRYEHYEYELGELIGVSANWNTPSKITDIKLAEKTFKVKSDIAQSYRSLSLGGFSYPRYCTVVLLTGIKPEEPEPNRYKTIPCPKCEPKIRHGGISRVPSYAHSEKRCPICDTQYYYVCKDCGNVFYPEPQCEHKDIIKEDGIKEKILHWEEEYKEFKVVYKIFREDYI